MKFAAFCAFLIVKTGAEMRKKVDKSLNDSKRVTPFPIQALSLGPKYCIPQKYFSELEIYSQFESLYDQLKPLVPISNDHQRWFKANLADIAHQFCNGRTNLSEPK
ncbi:unnamed protein product [Trichobilharzia regenti]|nr:unnamed protein product [Trichobilharzia regenti]